MIQTTGLIKKHGDHEVLRGVDFHVGLGEAAVVVGASGGGKSTFLRCINGLESFSGGKITVGDHVLEPGDSTTPDGKKLRRIRKQVGMVFQQFNLFPHLTVLQNVIEAPIRVLKMPREAAVESAKELLDRVGLSEKLHASPERLSGGQQQRVAIARALAMRPKAILFDEPTSALDPPMTAEVLGVLADLAAGGLTMIVVTHAMSFARRVAHSVHVFHQGQVVESGSPAQVFDSPRHPAAIEFFREVHA